MKVECLKALPSNTSVTGSTPKDVRLGEDHKADPGHAGGTTFPIQPWRTLVFCQRSWRQQLGRLWSGFPRGGDI